MSDNPYEAPKVDLEGPAGGRRFSAGAGRIEVGECVRVAWDCMRGTFPLWLGVLLLYLFLSSLSSYVCVGVFLVTPPLRWGGARFLLNALDGTERFEDLFEGFSDYGSKLGPMLLIFLCVYLVLIPGYVILGIGSFQESPILLGVGSIALFGGLILYFVRFGLATFFAVEYRMKGVDAMRASWDVTRRQWTSTPLIGFLSMLFLVLSALAGILLSMLAVVSPVFVLLGVVAALIGVLPALVVTYFMWAVAYRQATYDPDAEAPAPQPLA